MRIVVHMIGNAHIDPVWLWPWQAGVDEALATFRSAADRCDEYPAFVFTRGESWLYRQVERLDSALFARVRQLVAQGQWHITGGQYIQPDGNLLTRMGWDRQFLHGRRYFQDRFGVRPVVAYNVDTFGHPATLPDILAAHAYGGYVFHRPGTHQVPLPAQTFRWRGSAGGEVIGFRITPAYVTRSDDLYGQIMLAVEATDERLGHTMCFYGVGNHGGGPTKANIEYILAHQHAFPDIELRFSTPQAFFDAIAPLREQLPVVTAELQHTFPGCYSVMHEVKQRQRRGEHLLDQTERVVAHVVADEAARRDYQTRLDAAWDDLLLTAFHDILAGTAIPSAWESVRALQGRAHIGGEEIVLEATRGWARTTLPAAAHQQIVLINPDDAPWDDVIEAEPFLDFDAWGQRWLSELEGRAIPFQQVQPEAAQLINRIIFPVRLDARGHAQVLVRDDPPPPTPAPVATDLTVSAGCLANGHLRLDLGEDGVRALTVSGQNILGPGGIGIHLREDHTDTWTFYTDRFREPIGAAFHPDAWTVEETGPLRARVRAEGWLGHSWIRWTLTLHRDDPRLHIDLDITFNERFALLQMPIHVAEAVERWTDGLAGGAVERQPGPVEWPLQGWSRVIAGGRAVALITADAYSLSLDDRCWQWTLLRSPRMAWGGGNPDIYGGRDWHTDQGPHSFHFIIQAGTMLEDEALHTAARQQAQPPIVFDRYEGLERPPWGNSPPRRLWTAAEQRARASGRMRHLVDTADDTILG